MSFFTVFLDFCIKLYVKFFYFKNSLYLCPQIRALERAFLSRTYVCDPKYTKIYH